MWAGGRVEFVRPLRVGVPAERLSTVADVKEKAGRTGALLFVTVRHEYRQDGEAAILEEQDIVYRQPTPPKLSGSELAPEAQWRDPVEPTSVLLFRYSAVTFNGHRIHYDHPYVTTVEGYPGLVVHGPLIATEMVAAFVRAHPQARLEASVVSRPAAIDLAHALSRRRPAGRRAWRGCGPSRTAPWRTRPN